MCLLDDINAYSHANEPRQCPAGTLGNAVHRLKATWRPCKHLIARRLLHEPGSPTSTIAAINEASLVFDKSAEACAS
jgi:hypothetical protein